MTKELVKVVGYEEFTSKKGTHCVNIHVLASLNKRETHTVCTGNKALSFFVSDDLKAKISANDVGKEITICTLFFGGKNNLLDIIK